MSPVSKPLSIDDVVLIEQPGEILGGGKRGLAEEPESDCQYGVKTICSGPSNVDIEIDAVDGGDELAVLNIDVTFVDPDFPFNCIGFVAMIGTCLGVMSFLPALAAGAAAAAVGATSGCGATAG